VRYVIIVGRLDLRTKYHECTHWYDGLEIVSLEKNEFHYVLFSLGELRMKIYLYSVGKTGLRYCNLQFFRLLNKAFTNLTI
jgi:hypothetical protein